MPKVLICAYACVQDPSTNLPGGGDLMAWNVIRELRQRHELWVLTAAQNRAAMSFALGIAHRDFGYFKRIAGNLAAILTIPLKGLKPARE